MYKQVDILISKNQAMQIYLKHHDNVYKTPKIIVDKKLTKSTKILTLRNKQTYIPYSTKTVTDNTITHKRTLKLASIKLLIWNIAYIFCTH